MRALTWFLGLIAAALGAIAVLTYPAWRLLHPYFGFPFHRIGDRIGLLVLFAGLLLVGRRLGLTDRASLGYGLPRRAFVRELCVALVAGVLTMLPVVGMMSAFGLLDWTPAADFTWAAFAGLVGKRLFSGLAVGFIEETFLRGAMLTAIERESGKTAALVLTAILYSASHFVASYHIPPEQVSAISGVDMLAGSMRELAHPLAMADAFLCLMAVGIVLGAVRITTGNIAACIGLHAGWVWVMLVAHELSRPVRTAPLGFLLSRHDGFVGWLVLAWTIVIGRGLWVLYSKRTRAALA